ncbi:TonB-dependent receptor [Porticoccaceae bacterium LTM1]|nr:TonB-dependent receptor [Porticoccaceae bacterium LTM1]
MIKIAEAKKWGRVSLRRRGISIALAATFSAIAPSAFSESKALEIDIPEQNTATALVELASETDVQIIVPRNLGTNSRSKAVSGNLTIESALDKLLEGTNLTYRFVTENMVVIQEKEDDDDSRKSPELEEIVVTGSNIRGVDVSASPVLTFDQTDIEQSGFVTIEQFLRNLSQNHGAGINEYGSLLSGAGGNISKSSGVNLRGLGNDSTLVLLNGRRLAPSNNGDVVDISMIPLSAIERVDVLTDGASAIYGSDAVGGVVNFTLRSNYEGAETRIRYGDHTDGNARKIEFGQTFGTSWRSGNALVSLTINDRNPLDSSTREATKGRIQGNSIVGEREDETLLFAATQQLTDRVELYTDALFSDRDFTSDVILAGGFIRQQSITSSKQWSVVAGTRIDLNDSWQLDVSGSVSETDLSSDTLLGIAVFEPAPFFKNSDTSKVQVLDVKADGVLFSMSGGEARLAINAQYRKESLNGVTSSFEIPGFNDESLSFVEGDRNVEAVSGELFLPVIGDENSMSLAKELSLSLAARVERYDEFGSSVDPKIGLMWSPVDGVRFRTTWGTSFKAPLLNEMNPTTPTSSSSRIILAPNDPGGELATLLLYGIAPDLEPETATTFTAGVDYEPLSFPGLSVSLTYYDIEFEDRIAVPLDSGDFGDVFIDEYIYGAAIIRKGEPQFQALIDAYASGPFFTNTAGIDVEDFQAIFDNRLTNISIHRQSGLDFNLDYGFETGLGQFVFAVAGTYLFEYGDKKTAGVPFLDTTSTVYSPVDLKMNASLSWSGDRTSATVSINYVDSYDEIRQAIPEPARRHVPSWTTVNVNLSYDVEKSTGWLAGTRISLSASNLFQRQPGYVYGFGVSDFDGANADILGRYLSLGVVKIW